jgi:hypothetical protein
MSQNNLVPFGKYKGQPIEVLAQDASYCDWLTSQNWFREKFKSFYQIIINNFGEPNETPEHNLLQTRFLDDTFCFAIGKLCKWKLMNKKACIRNMDKAIRITKNLPTHNDYEGTKNIEKLNELIEMKEYMTESIIEWEGKELMDGEPFFKIGKTFEQDGWDVVIKTDDSLCRKDCIAWKDCDINSWKIAIEIKPSLGDDYPAILRQMKAARIHPYFQCLVYDKFSATGATLEQVKSIFVSADFLVFSMNEIDNVIQ